MVKENVSLVGEKSTEAVEIRYYGLSPSDCFFTIDGARLGKALRQSGYRGVLAPVTVTTERSGYELFFSPILGIVISQPMLVDCFTESRQWAEKFVFEDDAIKVKTKRNRWEGAKRLITGIPYRFVKYSGISDVMVSSLKKWELYRNKLKELGSEEEQHQRAEKFFTYLLGLSSERVLAGALAHEYAHAKEFTMKNLLKDWALITVPPAVLTFSMALLIPGLANQAEVVMGSFVAEAAGLMFAQKIAGENRAEETVKKNFMAIMDCIDINRDKLKELIERNRLAAS